VNVPGQLRSRIARRRIRSANPGWDGDGSISLDQVAGALAVACAYVLWSYARVFSRRPWPAVLGGLVVLILGLSLWACALVASFGWAFEDSSAHGAALRGSPEDRSSRMFCTPWMEDG
jgi:hypothetical protein